MSNPALQNAEIAWNTEYQRPFPSPKIGTKRVASRSAPMPSIVKALKITQRISRTSPPMRSSFSDSCSISRVPSEMRLPSSMKKIVAAAMKPRPPICISNMMTTWPNVENSVPVSRTTSPVTHTAEVDVNSASGKPTLSPVEEEMGSVRSSAPISMTVAKPSATSRVVLGINLTPFSDCAMIHRLSYIRSGRTASSSLL